MGEHPHDCPPECRQCRDLDEWQALCDELECDAPVYDGYWIGYTPCGRCARCEAEAEAYVNVPEWGWW